MPHPPALWRRLREHSLSRRRTFIDRLFTCTLFVKELRRKISLVGVLYPHTPLRGYYTLALPYYLVVACTSTRVVKEQRRKNLQGVACKIFRALDNDDELKSKHARSGILPRALIAILRSHVFVSALSFDEHLFPSLFPSCWRFHFAPLDKGADISLSLAFRLWGCEEFSGCKGRTRKTAPCRFCFFWRPKERHFVIRDTLSKFSSCSGTL